MSRKAQKQAPPVDPYLAAFSAAVDEAKRREKGDFDGLLGQVPNMATAGTTQEPNKPRRRRLLIADILAELRDYLLSRFTYDEARALLAEHEPRAGYGNATPVDDDVYLVLKLLHMIGSALRCKGQQFDDLIFGLRDANRQAATRKPRPARNPDASAWIAKKLLADPQCTTGQLWSSAPAWLKDVGRAGFNKRVTAERKLRR